MRQFDCDVLPLRVALEHAFKGELTADTAAGIIGSDFEKAMIASTPLGRIGQPDDIGRRPLNGN